MVYRVCCSARVVLVGDSAALHEVREGIKTDDSGGIVESPRT